MRGDAQSLRLSQFHYGGAQSSRRSTIFMKGVGAQSLRLSANVIMECTEHETVGKFHERGAQSPRLSAIFIMGVHRASDVPQVHEGGTEPETLGNFHYGGAQSLRRPANLHEGSAQSLRLSANFIMGARRA